MAIIKFNKGVKTPLESLLYIYPDPLVSDERKQEEDYIKTTMDYFYSVAISQYTANEKKITRNYDLLNGELKRSDFYEEEIAEDTQLESFTEVLLKNEKLPAYVQDYSIMTPPINTLIGEMSKRPDNVYVKAMDDDSKSEEMIFKTEILQQYIMGKVAERIIALSAQQGIEIESPEELNQLTQEQVQEYMVSYSSQAEKWASRMLEFLKLRFNLKEKSEEAFRDLLISGREFYHIFEDNSSIGFNVEVVNPRNIWYLTSANDPYISDPLDKNIGAYAAGKIEIMEISEIIHKFNLTEEEIKHLRDLPQQSQLISTRESNLVNGDAQTGERSIEYDVYNPLLLQERLMAESMIMQDDGGYEMSNFLGITNNVGTFGYKYVVVTAYHCTKKKVGLLTYIDKDGVEQIITVDENYKDGDHPLQVSLEWDWVNQWYKGLKIGPDIYYYEPFELLDYCPILGFLYNAKNTKVKSLVDLMKKFQVLYNIAMNKLYRLTEKDWGVVFLTSYRHIPLSKDGDHQDALEMWETEAREKGIIFIDDSPENLKAPSSFNQHQRVDLSRSNEIQAYYNLAVEMRNECWRLVGLSEQRLGSTAATETATGINTALTQSYAQTEPWFAKHEYQLNKLYQAILDATMYIESNKPSSSVTFITNEGENAFIEINGSELKLREIGVLVTSRREDAQNFLEMKQLAQAMLQNGASPYEISLLYSTKSIRYMRDAFKRLKDKQDEFQQRQQQMEEASLQQQEQQFQRAQQLAQLQQEKQLAFDAYQKEQDRLSKEKIAYISASSKGEGNSTTPPSDLDYSRFDAEIAQSDREYQLRIQELTQRQMEIMNSQIQQAQDRQLKREELRLKNKDIDTKLKIAKANKNSYDKPNKSKK